MKPTILALDTASPTGSVALYADGALHGEILLQLNTTHAERLLGLVDQLLAGVGCRLGDVDALAVVKGPGAFTGLRVGMATAKGLALSLERPLVGISTLEALAHNLAYAEMPVCAMLDARKNEVYAGMFRHESGRMKSYANESVVAPEELLAGLTTDTLFVGDGATRYRSLIVRQLGARAHFAPGPLNQPRAAVVAWLAEWQLAESPLLAADALAPVYIRASEAEVSLLRKEQQGSIEG